MALAGRRGRNKADRFVYSTASWLGFAGLKLGLALQILVRLRDGEMHFTRQRASFDVQKFTAAASRAESGGSSSQTM